MNLRIVEHIDDIDVRRDLGVRPRRLVVNQRFIFRNEYVYDEKTRTMFDFSGMKDPTEPYWIIRRGIQFSQFRSPNIHVFNIGWEDYDMTMITERECIGPTKCLNHIVIRGSVKFIPM